MKQIGKSLFGCIFLQHFLLVYDTVAVTTLLIITGLFRIFFALIKYYFVMSPWNSKNALNIFII